MDLIRLDQIPAPPGAKKGHYAYVKGRPAPVWIEDGFDWWSLAERTKTLLTVAGGIIALIVGIKTIFL